MLRRGVGEGVGRVPRRAICKCSVSSSKDDTKHNIRPTWCRRIEDAAESFMRRDGLPRRGVESQ